MSVTETEEEEAADLAQRRISRAVAMTVASAFFMTSLDGAVLVTALPQMAQTFGVAPVNMSLGVVIYLVFLAVLLPASGWAVDRMGARRLFAGAIAAFVLNSIACALAPSFWAFIAARALQGTAASFMVPVGRVVLLQTTRKRDLVGAMNISTTAGLLAPVIGPPLGGLIVTYWSWPWIFLLNIPIGVVGVFCVWRFIPDVKGEQPKPFDLLGFFVSGGAISCTLIGLEKVAQPGGAGLGLGLLAAGAALTIAAVRHFLRTPHPLISLAPVRFPTFVITNLTGAVLVRMAARAGPFVYPLMFQLALGMSALVSGLLVLGLTAGDILVKILTRPALQRYGFRAVLVTFTPAMALLFAASAAFGPETSKFAIFGLLLTAGMVRSFVLTGLGTLSFADVPRDQFADSATLSNLMQQLVSAFGVSGAALSLSLSSGLRSHPAHPDLADFRIVLLLLGAMTLASLISFRRLAPDAGAAISGHRP